MAGTDSTQCKATARSHMRVNARNLVACSPGARAPDGSRVTLPHIRGVSGDPSPRPGGGGWIGQERALLVEADLVPALVLGAVEGLVRGAEEPVGGDDGA